MIGSFFAQNYQFCKIFTGSAKPIVKNEHGFILAVRRAFADAVHCRGILHQPKRLRVEKQEGFL